MEITLNVDVECADGLLGRATYLIINPVSQEFTHLVVRDAKRPHTERLLPTEQIEASSHDRITVHCTREEWKAMEPFYETEFVNVQTPHYEADGYLWPYVTTSYTHKYSAVQHKHIPVHTRELRRGTPVVATDGRVGQVDELLVGPQNKRITHVVMQEGHLWGERDIVIPMSAVRKIEDDRITLNLNKDEVEALPEVPVHRHFTSAPLAQ